MVTTTGDDRQKENEMDRECIACSGVVEVGIGGFRVVFQFFFVLCCFREDCEATSSGSDSRREKGNESVA